MRGQQIREIAQRGGAIGDERHLRGDRQAGAQPAAEEAHARVAHGHQRRPGDPAARRAALSGGRHTAAQEYGIARRRLDDQRRRAAVPRLGALRRVHASTLRRQEL